LYCLDIFWKSSFNCWIWVCSWSMSSSKVWECPLFSAVSASILR
jgi:hypothetical protein